MVDPRRLSLETSAGSGAAPGSAIRPEAPCPTVPIRRPRPGRRWGERGREGGARSGAARIGRHIGGDRRGDARRDASGALQWAAAHDDRSLAFALHQASYLELLLGDDGDSGEHDDETVKAAAVAMRHSSKMQASAAYDKGGSDRRVSAAQKVAAEFSAKF